MTTKSMTATPSGVASAAELPAGLMEWSQQLLALQMSWWMSCWQLQLHWLSGGAPMASELPSWMVWHNGTEQLA